MGAVSQAAAVLQAPVGVRQRRFRFFDTDVRVRSDIPEMLSLLDGMFASFAVAEEGLGKVVGGYPDSKVNARRRFTQ